MKSTTSFTLLLLYLIRNSPVETSLPGSHDGKKETFLSLYMSFAVHMWRLIGWSKMGGNVLGAIISSGCGWRGDNCYSIAVWVVGLFVGNFEVSKKAPLPFSCQSVPTCLLVVFPVDEGMRKACGHFGHCAHCLRENRLFHKGKKSTVKINAQWVWTREEKLQFHAPRCVFQAG